MKIVSVDQGTTSTKGLLVAEGGEEEIVGAVRHRQILPCPGWVEHDATELLENVRTLIEEGAARGAQGIALANQGETVVAWDRAGGAPLANAIVWQDQRTAARIESLAADGKAEAVRALSGLPLDPYFSASKLRWMLDHVDGASELARRGRLGLGTSDSFFIERLTGRYVTDVTTASRTSLMNLGTCAWDRALCDLFGVPMELLPEIVSGEEPIGTVATPSGPLPLLASVVDQVAALYGHGCRSPGDGKVTIGTGAFALMLTGFERPAGLGEGIVPTAAWPTANGRAYAADGGVYTAAAAVEWLMRIGLLGGLGEIDALSGPSAASRQVFFVPALAGLACPHWDRSAAGLFIGMDTATSREDMIKAVLEGVAFRIAEVVDTLGFAAGTAISVDGGLTRSGYFMQFLADICQRPLIGRGEAEVTALGAAHLAQAIASKRDPSEPLTVSGLQATAHPEVEAGATTALRDRFAEALARSKGWR
ncbi:FGGY family carbohydrate kinase [Mesorhizobium sp. LHD-90]|uniref:FGGY family carbohydrate kinase n=1 Tax=Mesorhizobium sp. LHD-90 TaxID=3071414 RepID=UPI0027E0A6FC|nr:FGGY family carbohydrate kinase [Mesorhizobium sp. LHD-90]MDQ6435337.1 FGGY family carbohydrate kinase [Mesorhizobium sp. LHD-90]